MRLPFFKRFKTYGPRMILDVLEERIVLDASVSPATQDNNDNQDNNSTGDSAVPLQDGSSNSASSTSAAASANQAAPNPVQQVFNQDLRVVLVSNALDQVEAISNAAASGAKVITYDGEHGDIQSIVDALKGIVDSSGQRIEQLALLSHGDPGVLNLSMTPC